MWCCRTRRPTRSCGACARRSPRGREHDHAGRAVLAPALRSGVAAGAGRRVLGARARVRRSENARRDRARQASRPGAVRVGAQRLLSPPLGGRRCGAGDTAHVGGSREVSGRGGGGPACRAGGRHTLRRLSPPRAALGEGFEPRDFGFRTLLFSGEPGAGIAATKRLIEDTFGGACIDMGSMAEMTPWMTNGECRRRTGMHLWQDIVYTQVCDPQTFAPVPFGGEGTPVYTHLERTSQPMIRLVSGDLARWTDEPCPCGRTYPRLPLGLYARIDDMFIVRGENIYPGAIEDTLRAIEGFGGEFRVIVSRRETMDELLVRAEYAASHAAEAPRAALAARMKERLRARLGVTPLIELVPEGALPRTDFKARRIIDDRDLYKNGLEQF